MSPLLNRSCCPFWMTFTFESDDDRAPHLLSWLLCLLYLYSSTNIYQKYKSVELGDQLAPHLLSWLFLSAGRNRTLVTTNWVNIVYLQVRAHCSTVLSIWKGVQLLLWCIFYIFWCISQIKMSIGRADKRLHEYKSASVTSRPAAPLMHIDRHRQLLSSPSTESFVSRQYSTGRWNWFPF